MRPAEFAQSRRATHRDAVGASDVAPSVTRMLRALDPDEPRPLTAYRVPWRVDRIYDRHPLITNVSLSPLDFVRVFIDRGAAATTEHWGQMAPGDTAEVCLCDADPEDTVVTLAWLRPDDGKEYLWRFVM